METRIPPKDIHRDGSNLLSNILPPGHYAGLNCKISLSYLIFLILLNGCATPLTITEKYRALDGDKKAVFLDAYPDLKDSEINQYLDNPESLNQLAQIKKLKSDHLTQLRKPVALKIEPHLSNPIQDGKEQMFRAVLDYSDGTKLDVTSDATWHALPRSLVHFDSNLLRFGCVRSDITVSANFLDEITATQILSIKKPVQNFTVEVAESSSIVDNSGFIKLRSTAVCQDQTTAEISCQAQWNIDPEWGTILGCGQLIPSKQSWHEGYARVSVSYGGMIYTKQVHLPTREAGMQY